MQLLCSVGFRTHLSYIGLVTNHPHLVAIFRAVTSPGRIEKRVGIIKSREVSGYGTKGVCQGFRFLQSFLVFLEPRVDIDTVIFWVVIILLQGLVNVLKHDHCLLALIVVDLLLLPWCS